MTFHPISFKGKKAKKILKENFGIFIIHQRIRTQTLGDIIPTKEDKSKRNTINMQYINVNNMHRMPQEKCWPNLRNTLKKKAEHVR